MPIPFFKEIHIENTNACGYKCVMCPREKQTRKIGYMPLGDLNFALDRIGPFEGDFHLHGFGEPLLDRSLIHKIRLLSEKYPTSRSIIFSTLGVRMDEERLQELAFSGLGGLYVSLYGFTSDGYAKVHGFNGFELVKRNLLTLSQALKGGNSPLKIHVKVPSPHAASSLPMADLSEGVSFCKWIERMGLEVAVWPSIHNFGDGRNYNVPDQNRLCPVIQGMRRNILNITWDLSVIPCCYDFNATIRFGNLRHQTLEEIFSSPEYLRFFLAHQTEDLLEYPVCQNCEKHDYSEP